MPVAVPPGWELLDASSVSKLYQGLIYKFATGDESEEEVSFSWQSVDATNDAIVGRIHQYRYVDPTHTTTTLWSETPAQSDIGADWGTYVTTEFDAVDDIDPGTIAFAPDGSPALRAHWDVGDQWGFNTVCEQLVSLPQGDRTTVTLRYKVYLDSAVNYLTVADFGGSSTLAWLTFPGLVGGQLWPGPNGNAYPTGSEPQEGDNWSARIRVDASGRIFPYLYVQNRPGAAGWIRLSAHPLRINDLRGRWTEWEETCVMNTPGMADGRCVLSIGGQVIVDVADVRYRDDGFTTVVNNGIRLQAQVTGATANPNATAAFDYWVKDFSITSRTSTFEVTDPVIGSLDFINLPSVTTTVRNSLATYWVSWSDNVSTAAPTGETGGDWSNDGDIVSTSLADQAANRRASAPMVSPGTISGGSIDTTPTGSPPSAVSLLVGAEMRGLPVGGGAKRVQAFSSFALVYTATAGAWATDRREIVRLRVQTLASRLQDRLQALTYAGSGGENGTADMAGRTRPLIFGDCRNVTVQIVDPVLLTGQLHSRSIFQVTMVYDQGIAVPFSANYASYAALAAATVSPGTYATSLATGWIRMGSALGAITADVKGDNVGGYVNTHSDIIRRIVLDFSSLGAGEIDDLSFAAYTTAQPAKMGIFFPAGDQSSVEEAIERIAFSGGAFAGQDRSGLYRVQQLAVPAMVPHWIFDDRDIIEIDRDLLPYGVPWNSWGVGYAKNWTVQKGGDLAAGVTQTRRTFLESEYRYAFTSNAAIALAHQTSSGAPLRASLFVEQPDAEVEAARLIGFYALGRAMYRVTVKTVLFSVEIGQTIRLIFPRWNLASGRNFVVLNVTDDAATRRSEIICFG